MLFVILLFFFWYRINTLSVAINWTELVGQWYWVVGAFIFVLLFYFVLSIHWLAVCWLIDRSVPWQQAYSFLASQPYKYLPTSIFTFSSRARFSKRLGMTLKKSSAAQLVENLNLIGGAFALAGLILAFKLSLIIGLLYSLLGFFVCLFSWQKKTIYVSKISFTIHLRKWLFTVLIVVIAWIVAGLGLGLLTHISTVPSNLLNIIAANALAFAVSILAVFAPGGIGVRETIYTYFTLALSVIVVWRFITLIADGFVGIIAAYLIRRTTKNNMQSLGK
ncbi:hypothetical protein KDA11_04750 [Candidatus Saccharibacteria bacterium]|nr:hypothetical protein [Candidatus Saccharibacteria bacterium]